jgi:hypothetical protein
MHILCIKTTRKNLGMVTHTYRHSGGRGRKIMNLRPAWATHEIQGQPKLHRKSQKKKKKLGM